MICRCSSGIPRNGNFRHENIGQNSLTMMRHLFFSVFVFVVFIFIIVTANYQPGESFFYPFSWIPNFQESDSNPSSWIPNFQESDSNPSSKFNISVVTNTRGIVSVAAVAVEEPLVVSENPNCRVDGKFDCTDPNIFHTLMRASLEKFKDIKFYRFGKPVRGNNHSSCHMAWRYWVMEGKTASLHKDYRSFTIVQLENCTLTVIGIGDYHSGKNAKNSDGGGKGKHKSELEKVSSTEMGSNAIGGISDLESEGASFSKGKYLIYSGGGDRCKSMDHYLWGFMCMLGEAQYLNRTLVLDLSICLSKIYTSSGVDEEGKDFRFYFDFEHLKDTASVLDQAEFWSEWNKRQKNDGLRLHLVEDYRVSPIKLADVKDTLIMRKFESKKRINYWHQVCEGKASSVVQRPWHTIWKSRGLLDMASAIAARMNWDFDAVHVERGEKARNKKRWPNVHRDTRPGAIVASLQRNKINEGRDLYIATNEVASFFKPLKKKYSTHFLDDNRDLWGVDSDWYDETKKLNKGNAVEFDGYMRICVDTEVLWRAKKRIETFNDLTKDCRDGVKTCSST